MFYYFTVAEKKSKDNFFLVRLQSGKQIKRKTFFAIFCLFLFCISASLLSNLKTFLVSTQRNVTIKYDLYFESVTQSVTQCVTHLIYFSLFLSFLLPSPNLSIINPNFFHSTLTSSKPTNLYHSHATLYLTLLCCCQSRCRCRCRWPNPTCLVCRGQPEDDLKHI
jgi:hypothetical protein